MLYAGIVMLYTFIHRRLTTFLTGARSTRTRRRPWVDFAGVYSIRVATSFNQVKTMSEIYHIKMASASDNSGSSESERVC